MLDGVVRRIERDSRLALTQAYNTAVFNALTKTKGGLKPLDQYTNRTARKQTPTRMLGVLRDAASRGAGITITAVPRKRISNGDDAGIAADQPRAE